MNLSKSHIIIATIGITLAACQMANAAVKEKKPASYTETIPGSLVKFDMVGIPGGEIKIKSKANNGAVTKVKIKPMWFGKIEVTWDEYDVFVFGLDQPQDTAQLDKARDAKSQPSKPYGAADRGFGHKSYPAINMSYLGAYQYCKWLSKKTGHNYRLPTEAEWEYACRAGKPEPNEKQLETMAWFFQEKTHPGAKKLPNAWGLYDMLGNVAEWCSDLGKNRVVCGGSWQDMAKDVKSTSRQYQDDSWRANDPQNPKSVWWLSDGPFVGFRVVRVDGE